MKERTWNREKCFVRDLDNTTSSDFLQVSLINGRVKEPSSLVYTYFRNAQRTFGPFNLTYTHDVQR
jgi:hypothetical protein